MTIGISEIPSTFYGFTIMFLSLKYFNFCGWSVEHYPLLPLNPLSRKGSRNALQKAAEKKMLSQKLLDAQLGKLEPFSPSWPCSSWWVLFLEHIDHRCAYEFGDVTGNVHLLLHQRKCAAQSDVAMRSANPSLCFKVLQTKLAAPYVKMSQAGC